MLTLVGFHGRAGAGKTTCADHLVRCGFVKDAYAKTMKQAVSVMFDIPIDILNGDIHVKNKIDPYWCISYREMLQKFGTEACRNTFGQNVWVKAFWKKYPEVPWRGLVIEDVRFQNEAVAIIERGGIIIQVQNDIADSVPVDHKSEDALPEHLVDFKIQNNGSKNDLYNKINDIVKG